MNGLDTDHVLLDVLDGVGTITLNRPDRRNALSEEMIIGIGEAMRRLEEAREVGAIVITGAGGAFCSGGDVQAFAEQGGESGAPGGVDAALVDRQRHQQRETVGCIYRCVKPVIASLPGAAAGAGLGLALAADLRVGTPRTVVATAFGGVGLAGDFGVAWLLHQLVGPAKARELLFLLPRVRGEECLATGLLNRIVPEDELEVATLELATQLASGPSHALEGMKANLLRAPVGDLETCMDAEVPLHKLTGTTDDHVAAVKAFVNKQTPNFPTGWHDEGVS